jgi:hypothetical protein
MKRINSRQKGYRIEHELVNILKERGIKAYRVPLSGGSVIKGDIVMNDKEVCQVKGRGKGFKFIYDSLEYEEEGKKKNYDYLFIKADRKDYLVVMTLDKFLSLIGGKDK